MTENEEFKHICGVLRASGVPVDEFIPDGKLHLVEETTFYIGFQNFSSKSGKQFVRSGLSSVGQF